MSSNPDHHPGHAPEPTRNDTAHAAAAPSARLSRGLARVRDGARFWADVVSKTGQAWLQSQAFIYAAALAFFTVFSIAPVLIIAVTVAGVVFGPKAAEGALLEQLEAVVGPQAAGVIETALANSQIAEAGIWPTLLGLAAILLGATTVFAQMQVSFNSIWGVAPKPSKNSLWLWVQARLRSLSVILAIGVVLLLSLLASVALNTVITYADQWLLVSAPFIRVLNGLLSLVVITLLFAAMFKILPDVQLRWNDVLLGAFLTALLFTLGRSLIAAYLSQTATASTYGAAGSLALLLLWVNYSALIMLFGAAFTRAYLEARGKPIHPTPLAVAVRQRLVGE
ncbi:YihY/virulence factor BrkB family protein [Halochromatium salexigens]|uniref:Ribonuclease BN n=1 Tax=Halochromatium salexigens TaxID=49447 RepID=A0AAJ0UGD8_HALSE|nr:YihY/virulence factor BrkB family protein [Halochromatium salexigens]MBK5930963.1 ribonuclease BN [Halochromatium salexigens]